MYTSTLLITFALFAVCSGTQWVSNPLLQKASWNTWQKLLNVRRFIKQNGCDINLCFALQGSEWLSKEDFEDQKYFVELLISVITNDKPKNYCAYQYGGIQRPISPLTSDKTEFLRKLNHTKHGGASIPSIARALSYPSYQLRKNKDESNKIVIIGDVFDSVGPFARRIAKSVRKRGIDISVVAVGTASYADLKYIVGEDKNKILQIYWFFELYEIIPDIALEVCGIKYDTFSGAWF